MNETPRELAPVLVLEVFPEERTALLELLGSLRSGEWRRPTVCPGWSVKDIAAHILGDDVGRLSRGRDGYPASAFAAGQGDAEAGLLAYVNQQNESWVEATRRMSPRLLRDLLRWSGEETQRYFESLDPFALGDAVSWAGPEPAPVWLDLAREYTERWLHQQQVRDAVGRPGLKEERFFSPVLSTFVRALPHTFRRLRTPAGTQVKLIISGASGGEWCIVQRPQRWELCENGGPELAAVVVLDEETAWRLFTKGISRDEAAARCSFAGDRRLATKVLDTVSIIA